VGEWKECIPANVVSFSATAYFFGRLINEALDVPVGLICSSWGGTRIEAWMSEAGFREFNWVKLPAKDLDDPNQNVPTVLFNGMINPMAGFAMRGAIWYQGEANRNQPAEYEKLMQGLIENWRAEWKIGEFPFYFCQIAPYDYGLGSLNSAFVRDAQRKAALNTPNAGMACLMDVGEADNIHPGNKRAAGERLAYWALAKTYNQEGIEYSGPELKEMNVEGQMVHLIFDHAKNGLTTFGNPLESFLVAGENKQFRKAKAWITNQGITLFNERVTNPVAVRYAWEDFIVGELFNTEGLPASSFRTDDWDIK
jgi:sialate O-acetylesterase